MTVAILMTTYNGGAYLPAQLSSFEQQSYTDWQLFISDDGSLDNTLDILKAFQDQHGKEKVVIINGPQQGFAANFMSLILSPDVKTDYVALSDQDDIWKPDKLQTAIHWLSGRCDQPALYCGTSDLIDERDKVYGHSPIANKKPSFKNALVENIAGGNTMVWNRAAQQILFQTTYKDLPWHDWWVYLVLASCGAEIQYDKTSYLLYRQHRQNVHGANSLINGFLRRAKSVLNSDYQDWNRHHFKALAEFPLTKESKLTFNYFKTTATAKNPVKRMFFFFKSKVYRQAFFDQCALVFIAFIGKL